MQPPRENVDLECFLVTKHSWKGKYKRILSIGTAGISTYNPDRLDLIPITIPSLSASKSGFLRRKRNVPTSIPCSCC